MDVDMKWLATRLYDEMQTDEGLRYAWQSSIAMSFVDAMARAKQSSGKRALSRKDIHAAANDAADSFLTGLAIK